MPESLPQKPPKSQIFQHYDGDRELSKLYDSLWRIADGYAMDNLGKKELEYFFRVTD